MQTKLLQKLNLMQQEAVKQINGPVLVLAGAGSGKTRTLTYRIVNMILNHGIKPSQILAVTFTNKASEEMRARINVLLGNRFDMEKLGNHFYFNFYKDQFPLVSTFHAFSLRVLKEDMEKLGRKNNFTIIDPDESLKIIKKILKDLKLSSDRLNPKALLSKISFFKNELIGIKEAQKQAMDFFTQMASKVYVKYQEKLSLKNLLDFDDLIFLTIRMFETFPLLLEKYQDRYPYILVDEYQDTNQAQYRLVKLLSAKHKNVFVVGDDYQSIYAWRGANIHNILNFEKDYKNAKVIKLEQNYRSTQHILKAASNVIEKNENQKKKALWTNNHKGERILEYEASDEEDEALFIVEEIRKLKNSEQAQSFNQCAVLYRMNAQSRVIEEVFLKHQIPYRIIGGIKFYERLEIKDIVAYLRFINNLNDILSFERIVNVPKRQIGKKTVEQVIGLANQHQKTPLQIIEGLLKGDYALKMRKNTLQALERFSKTILKIKTQAEKLELKALINYCLKEVRYKDFLLSLGEEGKTRYENVLELLSVCKKYSALKPKEALPAFLEEVSLATSEENPDKQKQVVTLMTLHAAKGLEYDYVFIPGSEEGILPHSRSIYSYEEMEEERRLCYVGITRAKKKLWMLYTRNRQLFGQMLKGNMSRFLKDIDATIKEKKVSPPKINEYYSYPKTDDEFWEEETVFY